MKKIISILILSFSLMIFTVCVSAEEKYKCVYDFTIKPGNSFFDGTFEGYYEVDSTNGQIKPENKWVQIGEDYNVLLGDRIIQDDYSEKDLIEQLNGGCPSSTYACEAIQAMPNGGSYLLLLINASLMDELEYKKSYHYKFDNYDLAAIQVSDASKCSEGLLNEEKSTGKRVEVDFECTIITTFRGNMEASYCNLDSDTCDINKIQTYNEEKEKLKSYCSSKVKHGTYTDSCVKRCLTIADEIKEIEGTSATQTDSKCGFSGKLVQYIANIIRWVKYIIPVVVIVLGILDFIKATSAGKEDEIKKAQGSFVKILIAAALIFIVPFIIEFILDIFGFDAFGCGIIDL